MEQEKEPVKRAYTRPELVKFGRADRLTETPIRFIPSGFLDQADA